MSDPKKLSTAEILALARQKKAAAGAASEEGVPPPAASTPESAPVEPSPATPPAAAAPAAPKSTADILAAARAQGGGKAKPAAETAAKDAGGEAPAKPAAAPKSTADILAAARAQGASAAAKPAAAGSAAGPKSTADILAAARAGAAGAVKAAGAAKAAGEKVAQAAAATASAGATVEGGAKPSVQEMLKAVREKKPAEAAAAAAAPAEKPKPKLPAKSAAAPKGESRRSFFGAAFSAMAIGFSALSAWIGLSTLAMARFMMPNTVLELPSRFKIGSPSDFPSGAVSEKFKASRGIWIVRTSSYDGRDLIYALSTVCTHLGCTPNWLDAEQKFKCPCHGSGFYVNGINFEGPAPRPLERHGIRLAEDGQLEVDKSLKFQEELGQWTDEKSFVLMT